MGGKPDYDKLVQSDLEARINNLKIEPLQVDPVGLPIGQKVPKSIWAAPPPQIRAMAKRKGVFFGKISLSWNQS